MNKAIFSIKDAVKQARVIEEENTHFKVVTTLTVSEVLQFYRVAARFPTNSEIQGIRLHGIEKVILAYQSAPPLLLSDKFEKLNEAKENLAQACKRALIEFFNFK